MINENELYNSQEQTPCYFYYKEIIDYQINQIKDALPQKHIDQLEIYFALKACYHPEIINYLNSKDIGLEVMTPYEISLIKKYNIVTKISSNGIGSREFIDEQTIYTFDSFYDYSQMLPLIKNLTIKKWGIRLRIQTSSSAEYSVANSKLGLAEGDKDFESLFHSMKENNIQPNCLHAHITINETSTKPYLELLMQIKETITKLDLNEISLINIGGGFSNNFSKEQFAEIFNYFFKLFPDKKLAIEPGRYLINKACYGLSTIVGIKESQGITFLVLDAGTNILIPIPTAQYEVDFKNRDKGNIKCQFVDSILTSSNTIGPVYDVKESPKVGDKVIIKNVGAYTHSMGANWGYDFPSLNIV